MTNLVSKLMDETSAKFYNMKAQRDTLETALKVIQAHAAANKGQHPVFFELEMVAEAAIKERERLMRTGP